MSDQEHPGAETADDADTRDTEQPPGPSLSFGGVADAYERGRPTYPAEAVTWLLGEQPAIVLELGAGTGKLTRVIAGLGHDVHATDPDPAMLTILEREVPGVRTARAGAEEIPLSDSSVDAVIAGQAFHWFDLDRALPEIARVLRPGGRVCLLWNLRNEKIPWVRRLGALIGSPEEQRDWAQALIFSELFGFVEDHTFTHWQTVDRQSIQDLVLSRSSVAVLDEDARAAKLAEVVAFYDEYGRGYDGMQLPYNTRCFRADVLETAKTDRPERAPTHDADPASSNDAAPPTDGPDDDMLLIDFR